MFDINTIVNAAIAEAVNARITEALAQHANIVGALTERIAALEYQAIVASNRINDRIDALENAPKGEIAPTQSVLESLDNQEWFWEKIRNFVDSGVESAIDNHCEHYDHEEYDRVVCEVGEVDLSDVVTRDDVEDVVKDVINNASFSVSV